MEPYPFRFENGGLAQHTTSSCTDMSLVLKNVRGRLPFQQTSRMRSLWLEAHKDSTNILAFPCSYDGLSSRLIEEAGFPMIFMSGFAVSSAHGLPDTGYIAMQEMCDKIQEVVRQVNLPILVDGDTGYGSPLNVRRTVESFAKACAAGVMIEDQTWPKREKCMHEVHLVFCKDSCRFRLWTYQGQVRSLPYRGIRTDSSGMRCSRPKSRYLYFSTNGRPGTWLGRSHYSCPRIQTIGRG